MTLRYRPICQTDRARPRDAVELAGGWCWFSQVEPLEQGQSHQPIPVKEVPGEVMDALIRPRPDIAGLSMDVARIMAVLNVTPDSFSDGGQHAGKADAVAQAKILLAEGADFLDIGGESTRPGAIEVPVADEIARTAPVIADLRADGIAAPISIDTRKAEVATAAIEVGATLLNDVSAMSFDPQMPDIAAKSGLPICLMHAQGTPDVMQVDPHYADVVLEVYAALETSLLLADQAGIARDRIIVDPGIGFGKSQAHNLSLLRHLSVFHGLGCPILLGVSRKGFIGKIADVPQAADRGPGSVALGLNALRQGVQILRCHDIEMHRQAVALWRAVI